MYRMASAVILSEKDAPFLNRRLETYRTFRSTRRDQFWSEHGVEFTARLAAEYPDEITVLPHTAFFWRTWPHEHPRWMFQRNEAFGADATYAHHRWEAVSWKYLDSLSLAALGGRTQISLVGSDNIEHLPDAYGLTPSHVMQYTYRNKCRMLGRARRAISRTRRR